MFTIVQRIGAIPRDSIRRSHHDRGFCSGSGAVPVAENDNRGTSAFSPWLARARSARLLTEGL